MRFILLFFVFAIALLLSGYTHATDNAVELSDAEQRYLNSKGPLKMCVDPNWLPYEHINQQGKHQGMAADYIQLFISKAPIAVELVPTTTWQQTLEFAEQRHCDFISMARETEARKSFLNFTQPYVHYPQVIATTLEKLYIEDIANHMDKTFVIVRGFSVKGYLTEQYPQIKLIEVDNIQRGLELVNHDKAFAFIDSLLSISYAIQQYDFLNLKISGEIGFTSAPSIASRNDEPILGSIFSKLISETTEAEKLAIYNKWNSVRFEKGYNYQLIVQIIVAALFILSVVLYWNRKLALANRRTQKALSELQHMRNLLEQRNSELKSLAVTDKLTGLYNRIKLDDALEKSVTNANLSGHPFSVLLLDMDHFKRVNDSFGHQVGDHVLIEMAELLTKCARQGDIVARWGGEEFLILCHIHQQDALCALAERIRESVVTHQFNTVGRCTVSIGAALFVQGETAEQLIKRADKALYWVKEQGRNGIKLG